MDLSFHVSTTRAPDGPRFRWNCPVCRQVVRRLHIVGLPAGDALYMAVMCGRCLRTHSPHGIRYQILGVAEARSNNPRKEPPHALQETAPSSGARQSDPAPGSTA